MSPLTEPIGQLESAQIIRFVEEHQPPIVEAQFLDSSEHCHKFIAKSAIFTTDWGLDAASDYPQPGAIWVRGTGTMAGQRGSRACSDHDGQT